MHPPNKKPHCEHVVCDRHLSDMHPATVYLHRGLLTKGHEGFKCNSAGCMRFFIGDGYADLVEDEFVNIAMELPRCEKDGLTFPMYIQRIPDGLRWACPVCDETQPYAG